MPFDSNGKEIEAILNKIYSREDVHLHHPYITPHLSYHTHVPQMF